ncbi:Hypothetical_protein [Hexamita inflata]|uniref:Hypothetical_protein n=1 Tax=Hexamita inflata TaxID=28002 RepID=A0AA86RNT9_9EUKA|nr:Hypothetical protein HINF_LOCUS65848 [Hexamita inflata]
MKSHRYKKKMERIHLAVKIFLSFEQAKFMILCPFSVLQNARRNKQHAIPRQQSGMLLHPGARNQSKAVAITIKSRQLAPHFPQCLNSFLQKYPRQKKQQKKNSTFTSYQLNHPDLVIYSYSEGLHGKQTGRYHTNQYLLQYLQLQQKSLPFSPKTQYKNGAYPNPKTKRIACVQKYLFTYWNKMAFVKSLTEFLCFSYRPSVECMLKMAANTKNTLTHDFPFATKGCGMRAVAILFSTKLNGVMWQEITITLIKHL